MGRNRGVRVSTGRKYSQIEDAIIRRSLLEGRETRDFMRFLPGRTAGSIDGRISELKRRKVVKRDRREVDRGPPRKHRNIYLDRDLDAILQSFAKANGRKWQEIVVEAIIDKLRGNSGREIS